MIIITQPDDAALIGVQPIRNTLSYVSCNLNKNQMTGSVENITHKAHFS